MAQQRTHRRMQELPARRLLGVWAHPDDEAYLAAGLMGRVVEAGGSVTVLAVTDGEAGFPDDDDRSARARAAERRSELRRAMAEIGVDDVRFLSVPDGAVSTVPSPSVVQQIADTISELDPDVVTTFGPDGITGHPDHIATWRLTTEAWLRVGSSALWYAAKTEGWLEQWRPLHDDFGVWMTGEPTGVSPDAVELVVDLDGHELERKRAVLAAHATQTVGLAGAFGEDVYRRWIRQETFRRPTIAELHAIDPSVISAELAELVVPETAWVA